MIDNDDVKITGYMYRYDNIQSIASDFSEKVFVSLEIDFVLFDSIICNVTLYREVSEYEIKKVIIQFIKNNINGDPLIEYKNNNI